MTTLLILVHAFAAGVGLFVGALSSYMLWVVTVDFVTEWSRKRHLG